MTERTQDRCRDDADSVAVDPAARRLSRIKLISIFAIFAVPLLLASIWLHMVRSSGGQIGDTSRGQLIRPAVPLTEFALEQQDSEFTLNSVRGLWTLLYMPAGECQEACQRNLYHMRQVRLALNHRMDRVQRAVLVESSAQLDEALLAEHPGLIVATGDAAAQQQLQDQVQAAQSGMDELPDAIYLIDPLGNLMLRFPPDLDPKSMLKDLKHLLKVSRIG
ncbi:MAG: hypothetical protein HKN42_09515 [Granulosicoccus sp.]|nr:hypothetical protein [Granulosicoccus sp.]